MSQQAQLDAMIVKRIQEACAAEKSGRAMDLASLLSLEKSFHIAMKVGQLKMSGGMDDAGCGATERFGILRAAILSV